MAGQPLSPVERFKRIAAHQEADRVPLDLDGTCLTSLDAAVTQALKDLMGFQGDPPAPYTRFDERVLQALEIDFRRVGDLQSGGDRVMENHPDRRVDMWGVERRWTGQYWDIVHFPLHGATMEDLEAFPWPEPARWMGEQKLESYRQEARRLWEENQYVIVGDHPVYGVLELACWMCGYDDFLMRLAAEPDFVRRLFDKLLALQKEFIRPYYQAIGEYIHLTTSGDDFGTQIGPFISPAMFRTWIKPYFTERIEYTRQFTGCYFWHHTCGSVHALIPDMIDCGVEMLNPIQPGAFRMEPGRLKADFGDQLCFHGGFDTQGVLPFGSKEEIEAEVARVMSAMKPNGGYIFSAAHNIQADVPAENVLAMYAAAKELGTYT